MPNRQRIAALAVIALALSATPGIAQDTTGLPDWLQKAMAQESRRLKSREVSADDGQYRAKLAGKTTDSTGFDGGWYFKSDIKSEAPLECYIFYNGADLATLTSNLVEINISNQVENNDGELGNRSVFVIDAGAIDGAPFLAVEWMYAIGEAPNAVLGYTKVRAALNRGIAQACVHNYPGYRDTFADAFAEFVRTTTFDRDASEPYYEEVIRQTLDDENIGIIYSTYTLDDEGDTLVYTRSASLVPITPAEVSADDSEVWSWSTPDGLVINAGSTSVQNGELTMDLQIERNEAEDWLVSGSLQGKAIEHVIDGTLQPLSELGQTQAARALFAGDGTETSFPAWVADADPTRFVDARMIRDDAEVDRQARLELGPVALTARFDAAGAITDARFSVGAAVLSMQRIWSRGEIP